LWNLIHGWMMGAKETRYYIGVEGASRENPEQAVDAGGWF